MCEPFAFGDAHVRVLTVEGSEDKPLPPTPSPHNAPTNPGKAGRAGQ